MVVADGDHRRTPLSSNASLFVPLSSTWDACGPPDSWKVSRQTISLLEGLPEEACEPSLNVARQTVSLVKGLPEEPWTVCLAQDVLESAMPEDPDSGSSTAAGSGSEDPDSGSEPPQPQAPVLCALRETLRRFEEPRSHVLQETLCRSADFFLDALDGFGKASVHALQGDATRVHSILGFKEDLQNPVVDSNEISHALQYSRECLLVLRSLCPGKNMALNATRGDIHTCQDHSDFIDDVRTPVVLGPCNGKPEDSIKSTHYEAHEILRPKVHDKALSEKLHVKSTMRTHLNNLAVADPGRVLTVRKINRIGMDSSTALETYFSRFGPVERVMVSHMFVKSMFAKGKKRERPATTGFVIMGKAEDAEVAFAAGTDHEVQGAAITVHRFKSHSLDGAEVEADCLHFQ